MLNKHIEILEKSIYNIYNKKTRFNIDEKSSFYNVYKHKTKDIPPPTIHIDMPYIFEYYSAIHMTKLFNKPFYVYKDFPRQSKMYQNFPVIDKGIDVIDDCLEIIGQSKYYSENNCITYGKLATFLASEKLVRKRLTFYLLRSDHCKLDSDITSMIKNEIIYDIPINRFVFLKDIEIINNKY